MLWVQVCEGHAFLLRWWDPRGAQCLFVALGVLPSLGSAPGNANCCREDDGKEVPVLWPQPAGQILCCPPRRPERGRGTGPSQDLTEYLRRGDPTWCPAQRGQEHGRKSLGLLQSRAVWKRSTGRWPGAQRVARAGREDFGVSEPWIQVLILSLAVSP